MTTTTLGVPYFRSTSPSSSSGKSRASTRLTQRQIEADHPLAYDPRFVDPAADMTRGYFLADRVGALGEPWRSRFVDLIAQRVGAGSQHGHRASRAQLALWLCDRQLSWMIRRMLATWTHETT